MVTRVDWALVEELMERCVRGKGYVPTKAESELLIAALAQDSRRYRATHERIMNEARREVCPR